MKLGWLPPVIAAAITTAMIIVGSRLETYDLDSTFHCGHEVATEQIAAADILLVGNSQTGAAIDAAYLEQLVEHDVSIEKLALVQANIVALRMLVDDYVENRGAPKLVVLQPMVVRAEHWQQAPGRPVHPRVNLAYQEWDDLVAVQQAAQLSPTGSAIPATFAKEYRSVPAMWIDRQVERIIAFLSWPRMRDTRAACYSSVKYKLSGAWPYDQLPLEADREVYSLDEAAQARWAADIAQRKPADVLAPSRTFEMDQFRKLIDSLEDAGTKVIMVGYPSLHMAEQDEAEFADYGIALNTEVINLRSSLSEEKRAELEGEFRDPLHVNFEGAEILTQGMAELLEGYAP